MTDFILCEKCGKVKRETMEAYGEPRNENYEDDICDCDDNEGFYFKIKHDDICDCDDNEGFYTEFIKSGKEVFPKDMYPTRKMTFGKIKYYS